MTTVTRSQKVCSFSLNFWQFIPANRAFDGWCSFGHFCLWLLLQFWSIRTGYNPNVRSLRRFLGDAGLYYIRIIIIYENYSGFSSFCYIRSWLIIFWEKNDIWGLIFCFVNIFRNIFINYLDNITVFSFYENILGKKVIFITNTEKCSYLKKSTFIYGKLNNKNSNKQFKRLLACMKFQF